MTKIWTVGAESVSVKYQLKSQYIKTNLKCNLSRKRWTQLKCQVKTVKKEMKTISATVLICMWYVNSVLRDPWTIPNYPLFIPLYVLNKATCYLEKLD